MAWLHGKSHCISLWHGGMILHYFPRVLLHSADISCKVPPFPTFPGSAWVTDMPGLDPVPRSFYITTGFSRVGRGAGPASQAMPPCHAWHATMPSCHHTTMPHHGGLTPLLPPYSLQNLNVILASWGMNLPTPFLRGALAVIQPDFMNSELADILAGPRL